MGQSVDGDRGREQHHHLIFAVNANNHITTAPFAYDAAGNLTADAAGTYTWNAEGELHTAGGVTYTYDGDGRRVQKSNGKLYWYGGGKVVEESDAAGNMQESYVFFGGKRIANRVVSSGAISYYAEDFIGSSRVITTSAGATCYDADFYPYGAESNVTNTCPQNYKWTGKERDAETGQRRFRCAVLFFHLRALPVGGLVGSARPGPVREPNESADAESLRDCAG